jgi:predicted nucleotidyltransferase
MAPETRRRQPVPGVSILLLLLHSGRILYSMAAQLTIDTIGDAVARALGPRLVALVLYGSAARGTHVPKRSDVNTLLICDAVDPGLFDALAPVVRAWTKAGHPAPLIFTEREWRESADAFPIEYEDMREAHRLLAGRDPWVGIRVERADVRRQLEHELKGKLVRLRQEHAASWGEPKRLAEMIVGSARGYFAMLRAVLRVAGRPVPARIEALVNAAAELIGFPADGLAPLVRHAEGGPALKLGASNAGLAPAYLTAVARTAEYVNRLET